MSTLNKREKREKGTTCALIRDLREGSIRAQLRLGLGGQELGTLNSQKIDQRQGK